MAVVEIHIKNDKIEKIEGHDTCVYVYDHDINKTTTMIFKKEVEIYETWTSTDTSGISSNTNHSSKIPRNGNEQSDNS